MRILLISYAFRPSVGGIETSSEMLAEEFVRRGHQVTVLTQSAGEDDAEGAFRIVRQPRMQELWSLYRWAEVIFQNNLSLRFLWPRLFIDRPCMVTTQTWLSGTFDLETRPSRLKRWILRRCRNVAISEAVARHVGHPSVVVGNPYDDRTFHRLPDVPRTGELLFVGRLVSDKGLDLLLRALRQLRDEGLRPALTVAGDGPERAESEKLARELGLDGQVGFAGIVRGVELAKLMNAHDILVIPSRWAEPFGIVALEGIACGCVVVGSEEGGLPEAVGPCGLSFQNGSVSGLVEALRTALADPVVKAAARQQAEAHLRKFTTPAVAEKYLALFASSRS